MPYFIISEWKLGLLAAVYTDKGLHSIFLGSNDDDVFKRVHAKFKNIRSAIKDSYLHKTTQALIQYVNAPKRSYTGHLDLQGTSFQQSVWEMLKQIPEGRTMRYSELAAKLNNPKAYRAVARACATNPLPLVIPCHRVVGVNGLGGYLYGLPLKEQLLKEERERALEAAS